MVVVIQNIRVRSTAKIYRPISLLFMISKVFKKIVNFSIADHLKRYRFFPDFHYGFRYCRSTADLLTVLLK